MAVIINASTTTGLVQSADTSGIIELQNNGTTKLTVNSSGATIPTATVTTLNTPTGVLATQNGMTGIAKAWVNFTGSSGAINGSFNISSVTRYTTGRYGISFTTAMPNANYAISLGLSGESSSSGNGRCVVNTNTGANGGTPTASIFYIQSTNSADTALQDQQFVYAAVFSS